MKNIELNRNGYYIKLFSKTVDTLLIDDLSSQLIKEFLQYMEDDRGCSVRTRNQRLAAVYALAKYVAMQSPEHVEWCRKVRTVPIKKASKKLISYLEKDEMQKLLDLPNSKTEQGLREYVLLLFLCNTWARAEEASAMKPYSNVWSWLNLTFMQRNPIPCLQADSPTFWLLDWCDLFGDVFGSLEDLNAVELGPISGE